MSFFFSWRDLIALLLLLFFFPGFKERWQHLWGQTGWFLVQRWVYSAQGKRRPSSEHLVPQRERCQRCGSSCPDSILFLSHFFPTSILFEPFSSCVSTKRSHTCHSNGAAAGPAAAQRAATCSVFSCYWKCRIQLQSNVQKPCCSKCCFYQGPFCWERQFLAGISSPG